MPVNHSVMPGLLQQRHHRLLIHIHYLLGLIGGGGFGLLPRLTGELLPLGEGAGQKLILPCRGAHRLPKTHIVMVIGAQLVAVQKQHRPGGGGQGIRLVDQFGPAAAAVIRPQQKIPVAVHDKDVGAFTSQRREGGGHLIGEGAGVVVTEPGLKQVPQNEQALAAGGGAGQKIKQGGGDVGPLRFKVQVGD